MNEPTALLDRYEKQADRLRLAIRGLQVEDLLAFPVPGTWSIQQIILHLLDTELVLQDRAKRILTEHNPKYFGFDESAYARDLAYEEQSAQDAADIFALSRRNFSRVLRKLPPGAFQRTGIHSQAGTQTLNDILDKSVNHVDHHMKFIVDKREKLGKIMW